MKTSKRGQSDGGARRNGRGPEGEGGAMYLPGWSRLKSLHTITCAHHANHEKYCGPADVVAGAWLLHAARCSPMQLPVPAVISHCEQSPLEKRMVEISSDCLCAVEL